MSSAAESWWLEVFEALHGARDRRELFERTARTAEELGFPYCCYGVRIPVTVQAPAIVLLDSYPSSWMPHYASRNYIAVDPTVRAGARENEPLVWSNRLFARAPELWADARAQGLRVGIAQPAWAAGSVFGLLSLARDAEPLRESELRELRPRLRWLTDTAHQCMQKFLDECPQGSPPRLSGREQEILSWTADGKTSWEISKILSIAESTVNFHVKNIIVKLHVQNKIQAAAKASALGILFT